MPYLFHVTFLHALPSIARRGLTSGAGLHFGGGYRAYSAGKTFLTDPGGVNYWASKLEEVATDQTDNPEEGWVPIPLAVEVTGLPLEPDVLGSRDSLVPAYQTKAAISPDRILWFDGEDWLPLNEADPDQLLEDVLGNSTFEPDEDSRENEKADGERGYWSMDNAYFLPPADAYDLLTDE